MGCKLCSGSRKPRGLGVRAQARRMGTFPHSLLWGVPRSCLPHVERWCAARGSAIRGLGKGGALSLVLIVQATAGEVQKKKKESCRGTLNGNDPGLRRWMGGWMTETRNVVVVLTAGMTWSLAGQAAGGSKSDKNRKFRRGALTYSDSGLRDADCWRGGA